MHLRVTFAAIQLLSATCALPVQANNTPANPAEAAWMVARAEVLVASDILDLIAEIRTKPPYPAAEGPAAESADAAGSGATPETSKNESTAAAKEMPSPAGQNAASIIADPVAPEATNPAAGTSTKQEVTPPAAQAEPAPPAAPAKPAIDLIDNATTPAEGAPAPKEKRSARFDTDLQQFRRGKLAYWFKRYDKALAEWLPLAEKGMPEAQATVAWMYQSGHGVEQNYATALDWYTKAAEQGYVLAQHNLGILYENAWGAKQDFKQAAQWYEKAAEQGFGYAYHNLGLLYLNGKGKKKDKTEATRLFKEAYARNVKQSGDMLEALGVDVPKKKATAHTAQHPKNAPDSATTGKDAAPQATR